MARRFRYSRWDGTQAGFDLDAEGVLGEIADDLLYHGDLNAALRRALQSGMRAPDGRQLEGLRQLLERIARRRREELERHELSGLGEDIARRLDEIVDQERQGLDRGELPTMRPGNATSGSTSCPPTWPAGSGSCPSTTSPTTRPAAASRS